MMGIHMLYVHVFYLETNECATSFPEKITKKTIYTVGIALCWKSLYLSYSYLGLKH